LKHLGNGEGFTTVILTDAESRALRRHLEGYGVCDPNGQLALELFNRGIQRATDRIKAEFEAEQKARKK